MSEFKLIAMKEVDPRYRRVQVFENSEEAGVIVLTAGGWEELKEQIRRTKVKCEE